MASIALCMIVKNEEKYLQGCFDSVANVVSEIVFVDTGSTDKSIEIAKKNKARIFKFKWCNDFSAARNFALSKVKSDWVLYLDADERLDKDSINEILEYSKGEKLSAYFCNVVSPSDISAHPSSMKFLRFFRYNPKLKFSGRVHEQIEPSLRALGYEFFDSEITILHLGYNVDKEKLKEKAKRNLELLLANYSETKSVYDAFQIGQSYVMLEELDKSVPYFLYVIENPFLDENHIGQAYRYLGAYELNAKNLVQAEIYVKKGLELIPDSPLLNVLLANIYLEKGYVSEEEISAIVKRAYLFNKEFLERKRTSKFEIFINEKNFLLYGINVALLIADKELFEFFYHRLKNENFSQKELLAVEFYNRIYSKGEIDDTALENLVEIKDKIDVNVLTKSFKFLNEDSVVNSLKKLSEFFANDYQFNVEAGNRLYDKNRNESIYFLEKAIELNPTDLLTFWNLFNVYITNFDLNKLLKLKEIAEKYYSDNEEINNILSRIINKLKKISDANRR